MEWLLENPLVAVLSDTVSSISKRREALGLTNPGTVEQLAREVQKDVLLTNHTFSGMRADLTKSFSVSPLFQISHSFSMGAQGLPPYTLATLFGNSNLFMQGNIDNDGNLNGRFNYRWNSNLVSKLSAQVAHSPGQSLLSIENDYTGQDFSACLKALNPSFLDRGITGIFIGSYLQAITPKLSLGLEMMWQRPSGAMGPETAITYMARYASKDWIMTGQLQGQGALQATYWRKIADKLDAGVECQLALLGGSGGAMMGGPPRREGATSVGAKYEFRASTFRAQIDSTGRLGCVLEKRVAPAVTLTFAGDMDHLKNQAKVGMAVSIEAGGEELLENQDATAQPAVPPPF
ncbi:mitochondrial import receptor subunit TOM40 [Kalaharituber pfeilii]|nr:mitochondrial import receptor subunit TOM40 [Kalaharituber pfeilii]